jgi:hypothetical protein
VSIVGWLFYVLFVLSASRVAFAVFLNERDPDLPLTIEAAVIEAAAGVALTWSGRRIREGPDIPERPDVDD